MHPLSISSLGIGPLAALLLALTVSWSCTGASPLPGEGTIDPPASRYGTFDVHPVSPTYDESLILQKGNPNHWRKIQPKKSWQIGSNQLGLTPTRSPSSIARELEPVAPRHFVDGNPRTVGFAGRPIGDPAITRAWVRIDLPRPMKIGSIALEGAPAGMPVNSEVRTFNWDLWQRKKGATAATEQTRWTTVYKAGPPSIK